jgi:hypothetical protein
MAILFKEGSIDPRPEGTGPDLTLPSRVPADDIEIPAARPNTTLKPKQIALRAFVGMFVLVVGSATIYLTSRHSDAKAAAAKAAAAAKTTTAVVPAASTPPATAAPTATQPQSASTPATLELLDQPLPNRMYLQVGSLEKGVAEILAQGLRIKGVPATVAPGVSPVVSRIIVGPFTTSAEMAVVNKHLSELGFKPFPRRFESQELRRLLHETAAAPLAVTPQQPDVRR